MSNLKVLFSVIVILCSSIFFLPGSNSFDEFQTRYQTITYEGNVKILDNITIQNDEILIIKPGTEINITGNYSFEVLGKLEIDGTEDEPVDIFYSIENISNICFKLMSGSSCLINNLTINNSYFPIKIDRAENVSINNLYLNNSGYKGIDISNISLVDIDGLFFYGNISQPIVMNNIEETHIENVIINENEKEILIEIDNISGIINSFNITGKIKIYIYNSENLGISKININGVYDDDYRSSISIYYCKNITVFHSDLIDTSFLFDEVCDINISNININNTGEKQRRIWIARCKNISISDVYAPFYISTSINVYMNNCKYNNDIRGQNCLLFNVNKNISIINCEFYSKYTAVSINSDIYIKNCILTGKKYGIYMSPIYSINIDKCIINSSNIGIYMVVPFLSLNNTYINDTIICQNNIGIYINNTYFNKQLDRLYLSNTSFVDNIEDIHLNCPVINCTAYLYYSDIDENKIIITQQGKVGFLKSFSANIVNENEEAVISKLDLFDSHWKLMRSINGSGMEDRLASYWIDRNGKNTDNTDFILNVTVDNRTVTKTFDMRSGPVNLTIIMDHYPDWIGPDNITIDEDVPIYFNLSDLYFDYDNLDYTVESGSSLLVEILINNSIMIIPDNNWNGKTWIILRATDTFGNYTEFNLTATINPVNDPPILNFDTEILFPEDSKYLLDLSLNISDIEGDEIVTQAWGAHLNISITGYILEITPDPDWFGSTNLSLSLFDGKIYSNYSLNVTVTPVNDPPIFVVPLDWNVTLYSGIIQTIDLTNMVSDIDNDILDLSLSSESDIISINGFVITVNTTGVLVGSSVIPISLTDGSLSDTRNLTLTVIEKEIEIFDLRYTIDEENNELIFELEASPSKEYRLILTDEKGVKTTWEFGLIQDDLYRIIISFDDLKKGETYHYHVSVGDNETSLDPTFEGEFSLPKSGSESYLVLYMIMAFIVIIVVILLSAFVIFIRKGKEPSSVEE